MALIWKHLADMRKEIRENFTLRVCTFFLGIRPKAIFSTSDVSAAAAGRPSRGRFLGPNEREERDY